MKRTSEVMWLQGSLYYHFPNRQDATPEEDWDHLLVRSGKDKQGEAIYLIQEDDMD